MNLIIEVNIGIHILYQMTRDSCRHEVATRISDHVFTSD